jgi:PRTRC genetic system protein A
MNWTDADRVFQGHTPVVMVPKLGSYVALQESGSRFLLAADGLWLEARRDWIHVVWPVAQCQDVAIPCGALRARVDLAFTKLPEKFIAQFVEDARAFSPNEVGAVVIWSSEQQALRYELCETVVAGVGHLQARWPQLEPHEHVVLDLHSHGPLSAFFSDVDRRDTGADVRLCGVVGRLDEPVAELCLSVFAGGLEIKVDAPQVAGLIGVNGRRGATTWL